MSGERHNINQKRTISYCEFCYRLYEEDWITTVRMMSCENKGRSTYVVHGGGDVGVVGGDGGLVVVDSGDVLVVDDDDGVLEVVGDGGGDDDARDAPCAALFALGDEHPQPCDADWLLSSENEDQQIIVGFEAPK